VDQAAAFPRRAPNRLTILLPILMAAALHQGAPPAAAQTPAERVQAMAASASGFQILGDITTGVLRSGQTQGMILAMYESSDYMVVGFCGPGCRNLDLALLDPAGAEVASDRLPDNEPIVTYSPGTTGRFSIQADMVDCETGGCQFAIGVLGSSSERGVRPGDDMGTRLSLFASDLGDLGFTEVGEPRRGSLATDQAVRFPLELVGGVDYRIVGVCDIDCYDMDLILWDSIQNEVASDLLEDPVPVLALLPRSQATFDLEVGMVYCELEPCAFQVAVYARGEGGGPAEPPFGGDLLYFQTYDGDLGEGADRAGGVPMDHYEVEARGGQRIIVDLRSDAFDTLVRVVDPQGAGEENDDYGEEPGHSHLEMVAPLDGTYTVQVTSPVPEAAGAYILQVAVVG